MAGVVQLKASSWLSGDQPNVPTPRPGKPAPGPIDGLTGDQRFFMGWAQIWRSNARPEFARLLLAVDVHGPNAFRVTGPLANMPEFARAFGCKPGDPMVRPDGARVAIW